MITIMERRNVRRGLRRTIDPRVIGRYILDHGVSRQLARAAERELKRYLVPRAQRPTSRFPMTAGPVDNLWHTFLLYTEPYAAYCDAVAGHLIYHRPGPLEPAPREVRAAQRDFATFLRCYRSTYGKQPPRTLWPRIGDAGVRWSC